MDDAQAQCSDSRTRKIPQEGNSHCFLSFYSNGHFQICDSLNSALTQTPKKSIQTLYRNFTRNNANVTVTFLLVQKQQDGHNCGIFAVEFAAEILDGKSPIDTVFMSLNFAINLFIA